MEAISASNSCTIWVDGEPKEATYVLREDGTLIIETEDMRFIEPNRSYD